MAKDATVTISAEDAKPYIEEAIAKAQAEFEAKADTYRVEGATKERERIQSVLAQKLPGHKALVQSLAFDGKTTGPEAAIAVVNAERANGAKRLTDLQEDASKAAPNALAPEPPKDEQKGIDPHVLAQKAQTYVAEQAKLGNKVSAAQAVAHVTSKES